MTLEDAIRRVGLQAAKLFWDARVLGMPHVHTHSEAVNTIMTADLGKLSVTLDIMEYNIEYDSEKANFLNRCLGLPAAAK